MNTKLTSLCAAALLGCPWTFAKTSAPANDDRIAMLKTLKIDAATIMQVERDPSGTRTVVKLVLNPAKGSNINVEVWLPDADKWNARFLGLGNGGAAGKINPGGLASASAAGYAAATTDMGTAPNPDSGIGNITPYVPTDETGIQELNLQMDQPFSISYIQDVRSAMKTIQNGQADIEKLRGLIDKDRQWFKSKIGLDIQETSRNISFCQYAESWAR